MTTTRTKVPGGVLVLLLLVLALAAALLWARPWRPAVTAVSTGEVSCDWAGRGVLVTVPVRVEGRGDVPVEVRGLVHRVREPDVQPYVSTVGLAVPAGESREAEVLVRMGRREWLDGRSSCSATVAVGEDPPALP